MERSKSSLRRESQRNSLEMQIFEKEIEYFFEKACVPDALRYKIKVNLSTTTNMPYYGKNKGMRYQMTDREVIKQCCYYLIDFGDIDFSKKLLQWLTRQQNQSFRKMSKKLGEKREKNAIWDHAVPVKVSRTILLKYIGEENLERINSFLNYISEIPQISLPKDYDNRLKGAGLKESMPKNWQWEKPNSQFARYEAVGIYFGDFSMHF